MAYSDDDIALAAEYALGTLDAAERARVAAMMAVDADFKAVVEAWDRKLGVLNQMVGLVEPRAEVWQNIRAATGPAGSVQASPALPQTGSAPPASTEEPAGEDAGTTPEASNAVGSSRQMRRWRRTAAVASALAAVLVAVIAVQLLRPDWLPEVLRPKPRVQVVERLAPTPPSHAQFVAILQKDVGAPAFILTLDGSTLDLTVRKVQAPAEPGKSYELWLILDKLGAPRSLGVIGGEDFTSRSLLTSYDPATVRNASYAVTIEQQGGSADGKPASAPVYAGKLIETVPAGAAPVH
jgi:anti-sigma-K factor RskA